MSIVTVPTDARAAAKERFTQAAYEFASDEGCSDAYEEFRAAYEALSALSRASLAETLTRRLPPPTPDQHERPKV